MMARPPVVDCGNDHGTVPRAWGTAVQLVVGSTKEAKLDGLGASQGAVHAGMWAFAKHMLYGPPSVLLDAQPFHDPHAGRLKNHTGMHPENIARVIQHEKFREWILEARDLILDAVRRHTSEGRSGPVLVVVYCRAGKHRSVACVHIIMYALQVVEGIECLAVRHLRLKPQRCRASGCTACVADVDPAKDRVREAHLEMAAGVWSGLSSAAAHDAPGRRDYARRHGG